MTSKAQELDLSSIELNYRKALKAYREHPDPIIAPALKGMRLLLLAEKDRRLRVDEGRKLYVQPYMDPPVSYVWKLQVSNRPVIGWSVFLDSGEFVLRQSSSILNQGGNTNGNRT